MQGIWERAAAWEEASVTAETAMLMPVVLFTVFMALYLTFHVHNRSCLMAAAGESAVSGREHEAPQLFAAGGVSLEMQDSAFGRTGKASAGTFYYTGEELWKISGEQTWKRYKPVATIRRKKAAERLK